LLKSILLNFTVFIKMSLYILRGNYSRPFGETGRIGLLNLFGNYLQDFLFPALQQLAERAQAEPVKEGQQR